MKKVQLLALLVMTALVAYSLGRPSMEEQQQLFRSGVRCSALVILTHRRMPTVDELIRQSEEAYKYSGGSFDE